MGFTAYMRSILILLCIFSLSAIHSIPAHAGDDFDIRGTVTHIDAAQQTFVIKTPAGKIYKIYTNLDTQFQVEKRTGPMSDKQYFVSFNALQVGDRAKAECYTTKPRADGYLAEEVEIHR